jgi:2-methylisocitrate lyase-like PEP mutase family enzyme
VTEIADRFLAMHERDAAFVMPNPWDVGSARLLAALGFEALATTSSGHALTLGRLDGSVTRNEALEHATALSAAVDVPINADLEKCFADDPDGVAETIRLTADTGVAGCSVEDWDGAAIYDRGLAVERVAAAAEAARAVGLVLTARAENHIRGRDDLDDTIARLQAYEAAGAAVVYAPGLVAIDDIRRVVGSVGVPVNVLALPAGPSVTELSEAGVKRVSIGGTLAWAAFGFVAEAARELLDAGTYSFADHMLSSADRRAAFGR